MWSMWDAPSDRDYYDQSMPEHEEPEEIEIPCECHIMDIDDPASEIDTSGCPLHYKGVA